jgi:hypothetical protein
MTVRHAPAALIGRRGALVAVAALVLAGCGDQRSNVLVAGGGPEIAVMDFSAPFALDPPPAGWRHRTFWTRSPMAMSFATRDGIPALRLATDDSASMLFRHVDIALQAYPILAWRWYIEQPIKSPIDERTEAGDDHPARLFLTFESAGGDTRSMEIIWGNRLHAGDFKFIGDFPHYVANGGDQHVGQWYDEEVDLRDLYREIWREAPDVRIVDIALFCDSDETGGRSVAYFADVRLRQAVRP